MRIPWKSGTANKKSKLLRCNNLLSIGQARLELATPSPPDS